MEKDRTSAGLMMSTEAVEREISDKGDRGSEPNLLGSGPNERRGKLRVDGGELGLEMTDTLQPFLRMSWYSKVGRLLLLISARGRLRTPASDSPRLGDVVDDVAHVTNTALHHRVDTEGRVASRTGLACDESDVLGGGESLRNLVALDVARPSGTHGEHSIRTDQRPPSQSIDSLGHGVDGPPPNVEVKSEVLRHSHRHAKVAPKARLTVASPLVPAEHEQRLHRCRRGVSEEWNEHRLGSVGERNAVECRWTSGVRALDDGIIRETIRGSGSAQSLSESARRSKRDTAGLSQGVTA